MHDSGNEDANAFWLCCIDESGTHDDSTHTAVAAVVGTGVNWADVKPGWNCVLAQYGLTYYHGTEFNSGTGECAKLSVDDRKACVGELIRVISDVELTYVASIIERSVFVSELSRLPCLTMSVYDYLMANTIADIVHRGESGGCGRMLVLIEAGCPLSTGFCDILKRAAQRRSRALGPLANISPMDNGGKTFVPLQVADMIAYESYKHAQNQAKTPVPPMRKSLEKIVEGNPLHVYWLDSMYLKVDLPQIGDFLS